MAGGKGTRIASVRSDVPKPMINICGKPILEHQIDNLKACGLTDIILVIGYLGDKIKEYFGDGNKFGVNIEYFVEDHPLGTAGALFKMPQLTEDFFVVMLSLMWISTVLSNFTRSIMHGQVWWLIQTDILTTVLYW